MEKGCHMITFYDIQTEIEQKEIEAWYKLIRILAHEIMNSVTPLTSLTDTILMLLEQPDGTQKEVNRLSEQNIEDVISSVKTINNRTHGILRFVEAYRTLTDIPHPEREMIPIEELFRSVHSLLDPEIKKRGIDISTICHPHDLMLNCDKSMMEQVLINLLTNAMYALENRKNPHLKLSGIEEDSKIIIQVEDNGKGIDTDKLNKIFIPFYSTRDEGSGIGLSFSKFVIHQHDGRIKVESFKDEGSKFLVILPKS
jgi:signal transduction histidine kinase